MSEPAYEINGVPVFETETDDYYGHRVHMRARVGEAILAHGAIKDPILGWGDTLEKARARFRAAIIQKSTKL